MDTKETLKEIFLKYNPDLVKLYSDLLILEKESLNNRNQNAVIQSIIQRIRGELS